MAMNLQKILHSYKQWQDYNKQLDIGLMTLYHHQESAKTNSPRPEREIQQFCEAEGREMALLDECLHYEVEAELLARDPSERQVFPVEKRAIPAIKLRKAQISSLLRGKGGKCSHSAQPVSPPYPHKEAIKIGQYDVAQLSNLHSQRALNEMPLPLLDRFIKERKKSLPQTERSSPPAGRLERSLKLMSERGPTASPTRILRRAAEQLGREEELERKAAAGRRRREPKSYIKTERSAKPINYADYKLISLRQFKMREKGKDLRSSFRRGLQKQSKRYNAIAEGSSLQGRSKILNELKLIKLKMHSRTLMSGQTIAESKLREVISGYFTPVNVLKGRKHSQSL